MTNDEFIRRYGNNRVSFHKCFGKNFVYISYELLVEFRASEHDDLDSSHELNELVDRYSRRGLLVAERDGIQRHFKGE